MSEAVRPVPFRQFVLKMHSRCNLACTYCYVYEGPDQSWRERPVRVAQRTMRRTAERIAEHVAAYGLRSIRVDLHGGDPLLAGPAALIAYAQTVRDALPHPCSVAVSVQTNGTLLTADILKQLSAAGITVGLSLDGGSARLNRRRIDRAGRLVAFGTARGRAAGRCPRLVRGHPVHHRRGHRPRGDLPVIGRARPAEPGLPAAVGNWSEPPPGIGPFTSPRAGRRAPFRTVTGWLTYSTCGGVRGDRHRWFYSTHRFPQDRVRGRTRPGNGHIGVPRGSRTSDSPYRRSPSARRVQGACPFGIVLGAWLPVRCANALLDHSRPPASGPYALGNARPAGRGLGW